MTVKNKLVLVVTNQGPRDVWTRARDQRTLVHLILANYLIWMLYYSTCGLLLLFRFHLHESHSHLMIFI